MQMVALLGVRHDSEFHNAVKSIQSITQQKTETQEIC